MLPIADAPRREISVRGIPVSVACPYHEGHVLTAIEAHVLNQTRAENVRNNVWSKIRSAIAEAEAEGRVSAYGTEDELIPETVQAAFDEYSATYTFAATPGGTSRSMSPLEKKMREIAQKLLSKAVREQTGMTFKAWCEENDADSKIEEIIEANPAIRDKAEELLAAERDATSSVQVAL